MDYKQLGTDMDEDADEMKLTMVVMRDQSTGMVASHICGRKRRDDEWFVNRLVDDIEAWGCTDVVLKSDGEPAMLAVQEAIGRARKHSNETRKLSRIHAAGERCGRKSSARSDGSTTLLEARLGVKDQSTGSALLESDGFDGRARQLPHHQVNPKGARMKGARNGLSIDI